MQKGFQILRDPLLNRGTAFTEKERDALGLRGLLPPHVLSQDEQVERTLKHIRSQPTDLEKFIELSALHDRNETLFFRVICDNIDEMQPLIYTPTVGLACQRYGHIYQRPRGLFIGANDRGRVEQVLRNWPYAPAIIVVSDGERILGLGDIGANGMGIPVGKLSLYTACAGIHPELCLPVILDAGTNNEELLADPYYIGLRQHRLRGAPYDELVEEFIAATQKVFPGVLVQFEDFANQNAFRLLKKYRDRIATFNDDIQGTAAVTLAGVLSALRVTNAKLTEQTLLFMGAGEAATGIADLTVSAMTAQGLGEPEARRHCWLFDSQGLVVAGRGTLAEHKRPYAHMHAPAGEFLAAVEALKPTAIIGVAAVGGTFTRAVVEAMTRLNPRPIVFALSNPTRSPSAPPSRPIPGPAAAPCMRPAARSIRSRWAGAATYRGRETIPTSFPAWDWASSPAARPWSPTGCSWRRRNRLRATSPRPISRRAACTRRSPPFARSPRTSRPPWRALPTTASLPANPSRQTLPPLSDRGCTSPATATMRPRSRRFEAR
jgi:malate dehydrogenase (oxaloacetate-decarboxylating)(NADP+)